MTQIDPEYDMTDDLDDTEDDAIVKDRSRLKALERDAKAARETKAENERLQRQLAILRAGIDPDSPQGKVLVGYQGELTDELLAEFAPKADAPSDAETPPPDAMSDARRDLATGANVETPTIETVDPRTDAVRIFNESIDSGASAEDARAMAVRRLAAAGIAKDERVIIKGF